MFGNTNKSSKIVDKLLTEGASPISLVRSLSNYMLSGLGENDWRYMMGVEAIPALLYTILVLSIPKSPRWLYLNGQQKEAEDIIRAAYSQSDADDLIIEIKKDNETSLKSESIFQKKYSFILMLAFLVAAFNQFSGTYNLN